MITKRYVLKNHCSLSEVAQSCPTLCDPMDCWPPGSCVHGISQGKNTGVGCHFLLQRIFLTQRLSPHVLNCRRILYCWPTREATEVSIHFDKSTVLHIQGHTEQFRSPKNLTNRMLLSSQKKVKTSSKGQEWMHTYVTPYSEAPKMSTIN